MAIAVTKVLFHIVLTVHYLRLKVVGLKSGSDKRSARHSETGDLLENCVIKLPASR